MANCRIFRFIFFMMAFTVISAPGTSWAGGPISEETVNHFKRVYFAPANRKIVKWADQVRYHIIGPEEIKELARGHVDYFSSLTGVPAVETKTNINCLIIFTEDFYREALAHGGFYFQQFFDSKEAVYSRFHELALEEATEGKVHDTISFVGENDQGHIVMTVGMSDVGTVPNDQFSAYAFWLVFDLFVAHGKSGFEYYPPPDGVYTQTTLSDKDRAIVKLLYNDKVTAGMTLDQFSKVVTTLE